MMMQSIMKKRGREDGQISKEDYKFQEEQEERGEYTKSYSSLSDNVSLVRVLFIPHHSFICP